MADTLQVVVRTLHILFGIFWVGALFMQHVIGAALRRAPPPVGGPAMLAIGKRALPAALGAGVLTVLFGVWNQYLVYGRVRFEGSTAEIAVGVGLVGSLAMLAMMIAVSLPTFRKMEAMAPKGPPPAGAPPGPPPALVPLQKRMMMVLMVNTLLALVVITSMVVAVLARTQGW